MSNYYRPSGIGGFSFFPPVIKNLLIINGVVFFLQIILNEITISGMSGSYILNKWFALNPIGEEYNFQIWQLITYQFMHSTSGISHILFNMFALWMFGIEIENMWGSRKFLYFYLICGVIAGLFQLFLTPLLTGFGGLTIGASGAIYGVLIAFGMSFPNRYIFLWFLIPVKAKYLITFLILIEFFAVDSAGSNVAHLAHLGGALAGFIFIMLDKETRVPLKSLFSKSANKIPRPYNPFGGIADKFKQKQSDVEDARYYEVKENEVSQEEIDKILDKISQTGYQNLSEKEKKLLFEASKKMK